MNMHLNYDYKREYDIRRPFQIQSEPRMEINVTSRTLSTNSIYTTKLHPSISISTNAQLFSININVFSPALDCRYKKTVYMYDFIFCTLMMRKMQLEVVNKSIFL